MYEVKPNEIYTAPQYFTSDMLHNNSNLESESSNDDWISEESQIHTQEGLAGDECSGKGVIQFMTRSFQLQIILTVRVMNVQTQTMKVTSCFMCILRMPRLSQ